MSSNNEKKSNQNKETKMNTARRTIFLALLLIGVMAAAMPLPAMAAGTAANTAISNQATLDYSVSGTGQAQLFSCDSSKAWGACAKTSSNPADKTTFTVDRKIIFTVIKTELTDAKNVSPGGKAAFGFIISNTGNSTVSFNFAAVVADGGNILTDEGSPAYYVDANLDGLLSGGELVYSAATNTVAADGSIHIIVVNNVEPLGVNGQQAQITSLTVHAADAAGASLVAGGAAGSGTAIVFADSGNDNTEVYSTPRIWTLQSASVTIFKTSAVYSDPVTGTTDGTFNASTWTACISACPKAIPLAVVRYKIVVQNTGSASATLTSIADTLDNNVTIVSAAGGASWAVPASTRGVATKSGTLTADTNAADGLSHPVGAGGTLTATFATILAADVPNSYTAGELKPGETVTLVYDATIN